MRERLESMAARDKVKTYLHIEMNKNVGACMDANFETMVATHAAPYQDAMAMASYGENRQHASSFQALVLGAVRRSFANDAPPPPVEWLHGWIKHAYVVGGGPRVRPFLLCQEYPENIRLEWLRRTLLTRRIDPFLLQDPDSAAILAVPSFNATILLFRTLELLKKKAKFGLDQVIKEMYGHEVTKLSYDEAIDQYAPLVAPYWGTITLMGLDFTQAHALVFGEFEKSPDLSVEIDFAID